LESQVVEKDFGEYLIDVEEIIKKLISIVKTAQMNLNK